MKPTLRIDLATARLWFAAILVIFMTIRAHAASPGIMGAPGSPAFLLTATASYITQPDGQSIYSWGYGCQAGMTPTFVPKMANNTCSTMQIPGPTLIVNQGDAVTVTLSNGLPAAAGNTSILFPGFTVTTTGGTQGLLTQEAPSGGTVTYTFTANTPGTHSYYSGTQGDLQVEMGLYGAIIVLPKLVHLTSSSGCSTAALTYSATNQQARASRGENDFRLAAAAYDNVAACYDREYLFQFSEIDPVIHKEAEAAMAVTCAAGSCPALAIQTEPYHPTYFMVNGRSMPDDMDPNYALEYPHQPYNGNPHMHPGELVLLRIIGQGRWQHPFHEHGNHVRILARDGNLIVSQADATKLAGPLLFTTTTTPGVTMDGIFYWTGKGLNWDVYGHNNKSGETDTLAQLPCNADSNGYNTTGTAYTQVNYFEWCPDHLKPLEKFPFGDVESGGPVTLPDPNYLTNGTWYGGSAYLGPDATVRATGPTGTTPPSGTVGNSPSTEAGFAFMWHSHNEREITTNNVFPGGMMMMMLVDSREIVIDESN